MTRICLCERSLMILKRQLVSFLMLQRRCWGRVGGSEIEAGKLVEGGE